MIVYLALGKLQAKYPDASITHSTSYFKIKGIISGGTFESMREIAKIPRSELKTSEWQLVGSESARCMSRSMTELMRRRWIQP
jgi:hypothetical protein